MVLAMLLQKKTEHSRGYDFRLPLGSSMYDVAHPKENK